MSGLWMQIPPNVEPGTGTANNVPITNQRTTRNTGELDRDAFLMLLVTQMQHQDPLNPMDDRDFLAQMAQFSALESQQHMTRAMERHQAHAMIGKDVFAQFFCETAEMFREVQGPVLTVTHRGDRVFMGVETMVPRVDDEGNHIFNDAGQLTYDLRVIDTPLDRISWISDENFMSRQLQGILDGVANSRDLQLIGSYVQAIIMEDGQPSEFVEGVVDFVRFDARGNTVLMVNGREIFANEVFSVSEEALVIGRNVRGVSIDTENNSIVTANGPIEEIRIIGGRAHAIVDGYRILVRQIDELVDGLQFYGRHIDIAVGGGSFTGRVDQISIINGYVHLHIGGEERSLQYLREAGIRQIRPPAPVADDPATDDPADANNDD